VLSLPNCYLLQVHKVTFLYKLTKGPAGASFGLNVALMAGLPHSVVARAAVIARSADANSQKSLSAASEREQCPRSRLLELVQSLEQILATEFGSLQASANAQAARALGAQGEQQCVSLV
jgi:DNA mismatch repair ATPase MutS